MAIYNTIVVHKVFRIRFQNCIQFYIKYFISQKWYLRS